MTPYRIDAVMQMSDKRRLAYAEYGEPAGAPVFLFHGLPGSRLAWGFPLDEIGSKVLFWFCELDRSIPPAMGKYLSDTVPGSVTTFVTNAGHLWILVHVNEVLNAIASAKQDAKPPLTR
jgi:pimeloyl-ACP methyl ester carboxylesterase